MMRQRIRCLNDALMMRRARHLLATAPQQCCKKGHLLVAGFVARLHPAAVEHLRIV
jgi:hypothetical protein